MATMVLQVTDTARVAVQCQIRESTVFAELAADDDLTDTRQRQCRHGVQEQSQPRRQHDAFEATHDAVCVCVYVYVCVC